MSKKDAMKKEKAMYIYVVVTEKDTYYAGHHGHFLHDAVKFEQITGERCLMVPFHEFNMQTVNEYNPRAIFVSGFHQNFQNLDIASFYGLNDVYHNAEVPIFGICGGHQLMASCYNHDITKLERLYDEPIQRVNPEEADGPYYYIDSTYFYTANGFYSLKKMKEDPLFHNLPETMVMACFHYAEVKKLPDEFELIASTKHCKIEAMKHKTKPLYGTQFHPERYEGSYMDGKKMLENFAKIVDDYWGQKHKKLKE